MSDLTHLLNQIDADLLGKKLLKPETWIDRCFLLSRFLEEEQIKEADLEIQVAAQVEEISSGQQKVNMTQAENKVKRFQCYRDWRIQKAKVLKIENYIAAAKKHSSRLY